MLLRPVYEQRVLSSRAGESRVVGRMCARERSSREDTRANASGGLCGRKPDSAKLEPQMPIGKRAREGELEPGTSRRWCVSEDGVRRGTAPVTHDTPTDVPHTAGEERRSRTSSCADSPSSPSLAPSILKSRCSSRPHQKGCRPNERRPRPRRRRPPLRPPLQTARALQCPP